MHQHPRSPAPTAPGFPSRSKQTYPSAHREQVSEPSPDTRTSSTARGLGIDTGAEPQDQSQKTTAPGKDAIVKLNQIVSNYHTKAALIILHSRVELPPAFAKGSTTPKVNRWFNVELDDTDVLREPLKVWRSCDTIENRPPPLIVETYLDAKGLTNNQTLVILDENGKRWDVLESLAASQTARHPNQDEVILERWKVELGDSSKPLPSDLGAILPTVYKKSIVLFRSLFTYSKFLPAWKFTKRNGKVRANPALRIRYRILNGSAPPAPSHLDTLTVPLHETSGKVVETYSFGVTDSPAGPFSVEVTYRTSCDFRVDDSEALLSSRFMGADDEIFRPSLPAAHTDIRPPPPNTESGSLPIEKKTVENPDRAQAYGSLSTFHQVGPTTGASPISALRAARDSRASSPSPSGSPSRRLLPAAKVGPAGRAAVLAGEGNLAIGRRPSISFQPFKAPPLSASPSLVDPPPLGVSPRTGSVRTPISTSSDSRTVNMAASARRPLSMVDAIPSSNSASPKPAPISRYSSSFSHRRGRPSSGNVNRIEDDNSSGKASASSSAHPGSGLLAADPTGTSAESIHADDENISDFLKMLDLRKDLLNPTTSTALDATARRTTAALTRFQRMRDSNAALSDSMSSSMHLRSSTTSSKQLSGVPPMVAGTSVSTASSPGKPISPHTPHTPAIPSRLSSNSIVEYDRDPRGNRLVHDEQDSSLEGNPSDETTGERNSSAANAIDIPTSPRPFAPPYRRSSSVAQRRCTATADEDDIFPFGMRSVSLGAGERSHLSLSALLRQQEYDNATAPTEEPPPRESHSPLTVARPSYREESRSSQRGGNGGSTLPGPTAASSSSNPSGYQPRFASFRGRGSSGGPHSLSSASSSLARGHALPPHLADRESHDRDGSGSNSGNNSSTMEARRGSGQRAGSGRIYAASTNAFDEEEPLLFAMSDFGVSRRSLEENRHSSAETTTTTTTTGSNNQATSRRGSGRRSTGLPNFHAWP
ncbi:hypothetical protein ASPZODRAFT_69585 [Penicilliopsis zonata CBS 506.65]|uniref:Autophagy-related protein 13 n=1 Tax=Penicilliopsis zonata CBS 506.65 TaxID=1073090 RepID=A0A1L9SE87_9EURO|nr:hypothetical protein ASPZODRAFT_69585 [Penicilliopsis zonata CBS 506.65]OJJ45499.1 hypothetical protein ASPZODRAFT_69585 [Penicilliopsis zonata CBS 506.65]